MILMILVVLGKPFVLPYADDASWHLIDLVLFAIEFLAETLLASGLWLALSIGRPTYVRYLNVCNISRLITVCNSNFTVSIANTKYYFLTKKR